MIAKTVDRVISYVEWYSWKVGAEMSLRIYLRPPIYSAQILIP